MKCPKCESTLVKKSYKAIMEVECCPNCRGMWLDFDELDRLEDVAFDQDHYKGSLLHRELKPNIPVRIAKQSCRNSNTACTA